MFTFNNVRYKNILDIKQLTIPEKKVTCILGESGSGKTTLLRLLNKMLSYTEGQILYKGIPLSSTDSVLLRREVVMLPQIPAIFDGSIKDNLLIGLKFSEKSCDISENELNYILDTVHLKKQLNDSTQHLSGGEIQRLALARVLLMKPEVYLLDEPSASLDEETEQIVIEKLVHFTKQHNKTLIMVTHSKKIANAYSENTIRIKNGSVINE